MLRQLVQQSAQAATFLEYRYQYTETFFKEWKHLSIYIRINYDPFIDPRNLTATSWTCPKTTIGILLMHRNYMFSSCADGPGRRLVCICAAEKLAQWSPVAGGMEGYEMV